jgi:hypothetical protein
MVNANGLPLPATTFQNAAGRVEIVGGNIVLRSDGSFTELLTTRAVYTSGTVQENPITTAGDYTVSNTSITFTARSGSDQVTYTGALVDGRISYTYNNLTTVWQR